MSDYFTSETTKNALHDYRTESNKQHKYARFAGTTYYYNDESKELLNMPEQSSRVCVRQRAFQ